jgi:hypothetical protein
MKFHVWEREKLRGHLYSSDYKELSPADPQKICEHLKIPFETAWFCESRDGLFIAASGKADVHKRGGEEVLALGTTTRFPAFPVAECL